MDELQISGKRFISSRRIAKDNGYHTDYIGQLIRGGKIKGQKVGRTWYVDAASFDAYLGEEGNSTAAPQADAGVVTETVAVAPEAVAATVPPEPVAESTESVEEKTANEIVADIKASELPEAVVVAEISSKPEAVVTPELVSVVAEETPAVVSVSVPKVEIKAEPVEIPAVITIRKIAEAQGKGLRYMTDDAPLVPEIASTASESRHSKLVQTEIAAVEEEPVEVIVARPQNSFALVGILAAGLFMFVISATLSSALSQTIHIQDGNPASVGYSLNW